MEARLSASNEALEEEREGRRDDVEGLQAALRDERSVLYRLEFVVVPSALLFFCLFYSRPWFMLGAV